MLTTLFLAVDFYKKIQTLLEHILKGDQGDGIPNILSDDDTFVTDKRQKPLTQKKIDTIYLEGIPIADLPLVKNYSRNQKLVDLSKIPDNIQKQVQGITTMVQLATTVFAIVAGSFALFGVGTYVGLMREVRARFSNQLIELEKMRQELEGRLQESDHLRQQVQ